MNEFEEPAFFEVEFEDRVFFQVAREVTTQTLTWWWLSFVDEERPEGDKFLGACIVQAHGPVTAAVEAHARKCNPGGQVQSIPFPEYVDLTPWGNRLLDRAECAEFDTWMEKAYP